MRIWQRSQATAEEVSRTATAGDLAAHRYAVVDCETTGLFPGYHHRIIELAVVQLDDPWTVSSEWSTLINPDRDLGDADIHGIRGRELREAPSFEGIAAHVSRLIDGRVIVAHNARFDTAFLEAEFTRIGTEVAPLAAMCTIFLAHRVGLRARSSSLIDCCRSEGITVTDSHHALADARQCAELWGALAAKASAHPGTTLAECGCAGPITTAAWPLPAHEAEPLARGAAPPPAEKTYLAGLVADRGALDGHGAEHGAYLELLDRALEDRRLSEGECEDLRRAAELYGLAGSELEAVHGAYLERICESALADGVVTDRERYDLNLVAELLALGDLDERLARLVPGGPAAPATASAAGELVGKSVCFTGKLLCTIDGERVNREQAQRLAEDAGLVAMPRVTQGLDLLVVADPETSSGKAKQARANGTRIVAEAVFWPMIGVSVD